MKFLSTQEIGEKWGLSKRHVAILCVHGCIPDAPLTGNIWMILENSRKHLDDRIKRSLNIRMPLLCYTRQSRTVLARLLVKVA